MTTTSLASWNGRLLPLDQVQVSVLDRGFLFGDGVYEVIRLYQGKPFLLKEHLERLAHSLRELRIEHPVARVKANIEQLLARNLPSEGYIYIQITRGCAMRNHAFPRGIVPNELIYAAPQGDLLADYRQKGIRVIVVPDIRWHRPDIKSLNLLPNVLAKQQAVEGGAQEAVLVRWDGRVTEATSSNVFVVNEGTVQTPRSDHWILQGISRNLVSKLCQKNGIRFEEIQIERGELFSCDEMFLSSTFSEIIPVAEVDDRKIAVGPVTQRLVRLFHEAIEKWTDD